MKPTPQAIRAAKLIWHPCPTSAIDGDSPIPYYDRKIQTIAEIIDREMGELIEELPVKLASALWNCSTLRHGMFTPPDFPRICERVIREALNLKPNEKQ